MKCTDVRILLGALADGELGDEQLRQRLVAHMEECGSCRQEYAIQAEVKQMFARLEREEASFFLAARTMSAIAAQKRTQLVWNWRWAYAGAAAAVVLLVSLGSLFLVQPQSADVYKALPDSTSHRVAVGGPSSILPEEEGVTYSSFPELVERRHDEAQELLRVGSEWMQLDNTVRVLSGDEGEESIYKELPGDEENEEQSAQEGND